MDSASKAAGEAQPVGEAPKKIEGEVTPTPSPAVEPPVAVAVDPVAKVKDEPPMTLDQLGAKFKTFRSRVVDAGLHRVADIIDGVLGAIEGKKG